LRVEPAMTVRASCHAGLDPASMLRMPIRTAMDCGSSPQ